MVCLQAAAGVVPQTHITGSIKDLIPSHEYRALQQNNMVSLQFAKTKPVSCNNSSLVALVL
jgi:hypothetical protein